MAHSDFVEGWVDTSFVERSFFAQVRIGGAGEAVWGDEIDLCPDALYLKATGKKPEDLFPGLRREEARA